MGGLSSRVAFLIFNAAVALAACILPASLAGQDSSSSSKNKTHSEARTSDPVLDGGSVKAGVYRNSTFGFSVRVPEGWVLRTEEMNAGNPRSGGCPHACGKV